MSKYKKEFCNPFMTEIYKKRLDDKMDQLDYDQLYDYLICTRNKYNKRRRQYKAIQKKCLFDAEGKRKYRTNYLNTRCYKQKNQNDPHIETLVMDSIKDYYKYALSDYTDAKYYFNELKKMMNFIEKHGYSIYNKDGKLKKTSSIKALYTRLTKK